MSYNNVADVATPSRNYVDNPSFINWQRGGTFALASGTRTVVADRWKAYRGATGCTVSRRTGFVVSGSPSSPKFCLRLARDSGNSSVTLLRLWHQLHEQDARGLAGQYVTLSFDVRAGADYSGGALGVLLFSGTGGSQAADLSTGAASAFATGGVVTTVSDFVTPNTTAERVFCAPVLLPDDTADLAIQIQWSPTGTAGAADYIEIANVKLEIGEVATDFVQPAERDQFDVCVYTYRVVGRGMAGVVRSATDIFVGAVLPPMRTTPSVALLDQSILVGVSGGTSASAGSTIVSSGVGADSLWVRLDGFSGLTAGQGVIVLDADIIALDAELLS